MRCFIAIRYALHFQVLFFILSGCLLSGCKQRKGPEISQEKKLTPPVILWDSTKEMAVNPEMEEALAKAGTNYLEDTTDLIGIIWYGRRLAYTHRFQEAINLYSRGIVHHPKAPELYRHRGHRQITVRRFEAAIQDLEKAASLAQGKPRQVEPDGIPNKLNIPLSNLHYNIYYHLGVARYLSGNFSESVDAFRQSLAYADNDDLKVATAYWLVLCNLQLEKPNHVKQWLATIHPDMEIIENQAYYEQLLFFKNPNARNLSLTFDTLQVIDPTRYYGISLWKESTGDKALAALLRRQILNNTNWAYFGYIAAEADSARLIQD